MNDAADVLCDLRVLGVRVELDGDEVRCRAPRGALTPDLVRRLRAAKPQVQALLVAEDAEIAWRADAIGARVAASAGGPDAFVVRDTPPAPNRCRSCGDPTPDGGTAKCPLCCLASARVLDERRERRDIPAERAS